MKSNQFNLAGWGMKSKNKIQGTPVKETRSLSVARAAAGWG
jgi:hypothetical protein